MFTLSFDRKNRVLLVHYSGIFSSEDIAAGDAAALRFVAREGLMRGVLDFSAVEAVAVSSARLVARGQQQSILQDENRVFVAPQPEMYQLSRAFADYQRIAGRIEPKVVATLEEAYALLGLQDAQFEPVEGP